MDEQRAGRQLHRYRSRIAKMAAVLEWIEKEAENGLCSVSDQTPAGRTARGFLDRIGRKASNAKAKPDASRSPLATKEKP